MFILLTILSLSPLFSTAPGTHLEVNIYWMSKFPKTVQFLPYFCISFGLIEIYNIFIIVAFF